MRINENIAWAKSILNKNNINKDSEEYKDFLKIREICGKNNGYIGILTKLRFIDKVLDMEEIESIFNVLKNSQIDVNKLNKLSYDDILNIFYDELTNKSDIKDYELYYKDDIYSYFKVFTYKGILKIGSPSWCLKTKSNWDSYQSKFPEQWVVVFNKYKNNLISPDNNYLENYSNLRRPWVRYGVSIKSENNLISWVGNDDNNNQLNFNPKYYTFFGILCTIFNLTKNIKKSYFDEFFGCQKITSNWFKVLDVSKFESRIKLTETNLLKKKDEEFYVKFSKTYSSIPVILILNTYNFQILYPTKKSDDKIEVVNIGPSSEIKSLILDFIKENNDPYFYGIKLKNNMLTLDEIKSNKQFIAEFDKWVIIDRNKDYYLIVNKDVDNFDIITRNIDIINDNMDNPIAWYLDKSNYLPLTYSKSPVRDFQKEVIDYIKSNVTNKSQNKIGSFFDFLKKESLLHEEVDEFDEKIGDIEKKGFLIKEKFGEITISKGNSYINFFLMKDTYNIVEFNDNLDLSDVYSKIGEECYFISSIVIDEEDSSILIKRFLQFVKDFANIDEIKVICLVAEPFLSKKMSYERLVLLYNKLGFISYEKISDESLLMYMHL